MTEKNEKHSANRSRFRRWLASPSIRPWLVYSILALAVLLPLLKPGYIFGLDMIFTPTLAMPTEMSQSYLFYTLLHGLNLLVPAIIIQKVLLFGVLLLAGTTMHRLVEALRPAHADTKLWKWAAYFGGVLYLWNPFTYTRFIVGQYEVLLGYALLPLFTLLTWKFLRQPRFERAAALAGITILISIVSIHTLGMAALITLGLAGGYVWKRRRDAAWLKGIARCGLITLATVLIASSYWLVPLITGHGATSESIAQFTTADRQAFETVPGELGLVGNVLALQGFWGDNQNVYLLPEDVLTLWWVPIAALWMLVAVGALWSWRNRRPHALLFGGVIAVGLVLAIGTAGTWFAGLNTWLFDHVPFFAAYQPFG